MINMVDEYIDEAEEQEESVVEAFDVNYSCLRCGKLLSQTPNCHDYLRSSVFVDSGYLPR